MGAPATVPPPGFDDLTVEDQIDYLQRLWRRIARRPEDVGVPDWHMELLESRLDRMERDGDRGRPWEEVRAELKARLEAVHEK